jgi:hypothetical protein
MKAVGMASSIGGAVEPSTCIRNVICVSLFEIPSRESVLTAAKLGG